MSHEVFGEIVPFVYQRVYEYDYDKYHIQEIEEL